MTGADHMSNVVDDPPGDASLGSADALAPAAWRAEQVLPTRTADLAWVVGEELERRWPVGGSMLDDACRHALVPSGKLFRPVLLLESAVAVGGEVTAVLPAAVGAETGHVASLIHDDIIDGDDTRRGRAAVHREYGVGEAIVAGDALLFYLFACLAECRRTGVADDRIVGALDAVARSGLDLCRGQSMEAELCAAFRCDVDAYLTMIKLKTSAFFRGACQCGGILGGAPPAWIDALGRYGDHMGMAFQIHDDLLAYTSDSEAMGKAATSDIRNRRLTLPVLLARQAGGDEAAALIDTCLFDNDDAETALAMMGRLLTRTGAIAAAADMARDYASMACEALLVLPDSPSRETLAHFARLAVERDA